MSGLQSEEIVKTKVKSWLLQIVIGHNLCPFALKPWRAGLVHFAVCDGKDPMGVVLEELDQLLALRSHERATTLVILPQGLEEFEDFLDLVDDVDALLEQSGASQHVQIATFHPDYQFEDTHREQASNYTNRSPYPVVHLLRVEDVADAVASMPGVEQIPERNIAHFEALGHSELVRIWDDLLGQG